MDREINLDPIRALEKQIQDHERAAIRLKRVRNFVECINSPSARDTGQHFLLERHSRRRLQRGDEGLVQLPPRLPPLARGYLAYSEDLVLLGQYDTGLVKVVRS